jgi:16S rRNA (uracil1498-N3)-methyltransferase
MKSLFSIAKNQKRKVVKLERAEKIVVSAMKQSVKAFLPKVNEMIDFKKFIKSENAEAKYIAHCRDGEKQNLKDCINNHNNILILIGAEGDFSEAEVKLANENGYTSITLGESRLRTETAGVVACHTVNLLND